MATNQVTVGHQDHDDDAHAEHHPSLLTYVKIAIILAVITGVEVAIYYMDFFHEKNLLVPTLVVLSIIKFVMVVSFFMHLKFDKPLLGWTFFLALIASLAVFIGMYAVFHFHEMTQFVGYLTSKGKR